MELFVNYKYDNPKIAPFLDSPPKKIQINSVSHITIEQFNF